jgi:TolB protein
LTAATIATRLTDYGGAESDAALSPDGRSFVFVSEHGGTPDIWLRQVSGGDPVRLTDDDAEENSPAYSPDGEFIYFARTDANGTAIWRMGALGGQRQKVISDISAAGGGPILIGSAPRTFSLSPDGRRIAYYQNGSILRSAIDGSSPRPIAAAAMPSAGRPGWSPDGRFLSFVRGGLFAPSNLFVLDLTTGRERQVTHFSHSVEGVYSQAWLPDSRHLVVCYVPSSRQ